MENLKCPKCGEELETVAVYSQCMQFGTLKGNKIVDYSSVESVLETQGIECLSCGADLTKVIKED